MRERGLLLAAALFSCQWLCACRESMPSERLIVLGIDGLERSMAERMIAQGQLPGLAALMEQGIYADIELQRPILSPVVWTCYASGYPGEVHGIGGWANSSGHGYSSADVRTWRIWDAATAAEQRSLVAGWLMTWPASPITGSMITDRFVWSLPLDKSRNEELLEVDRRKRSTLYGTLWPSALDETVAACVPEDSWLEAHDLGYQVREYGTPFHPLKRDETQLCALEKLFPAGDYRSAFIYLSGADQVSHLYWPFTQEHLLRKMRDDPQARVLAVRQAWERSSPYRRPYPLPEGGSRHELELAGRWIPDVYRYMDDAVIRARALMRPGDTLVVLSDHGFRVSPSQPLLHGSHGDLGILLAVGERVKGRGEGLRLDELDIGPTLLALSDLPVARDMEGRIRDDLFVVSRERTLETRVLERAHTQPAPDLSDAYQQLQRQLEALGYVDPGGKPVVGARRKR